jgi:ATP-binding cassette subfamily F protein 3
MIKLTGVTKAFAGRRVLDNVSLTVNPRECVGVVGANGSGKTTLLRLITREEGPDAGALIAGGRIGYLRQGYAAVAHQRAGDVFPRAFGAVQAQRDLAAAADALARAAEDKSRALTRAYDAALARVSEPSGDAARAAWGELALRDVTADESIASLSGGEQTKLGLIDLVASEPDTLLLDEPTNNLDLPALAWLDDFVQAFPGPIIIVSHDRALLDEHATSIVELDGATGTAERFPGGYTDYAGEKARRQLAAWEAYGRQQRRERRIERAISDLKSRAMRTENSTIHFHYRKRAAKVARRAVTLERRLRRELDADDRLARPRRPAWSVQAALPDAARAGDRMLLLSGGTLAVGGRELLRDVDLSIGWGERIVLIGPNGSGKTSLLRAVAGEAPLAGGELRTSAGARIGVLAQEEPSPAAGETALTVVRATAPLSETEARRFLHRFLFSGDEPLAPVARLSYGERRRLGLARLILAGANLLLLDEPTNHLDIPSREAFEAALDAYRGAMLVVTHDRYFIERFAGRVVAIEDGRLREL